MGENIYAVGGYEARVTDSVLQFDGKEWKSFPRLNMGRSALKVVVLRGWPHPEKLLSSIPPGEKSPSPESARSANGMPSGNSISSNSASSFLSRLMNNMF
ncbi:hypothetical protein AB6A40_011005 [Gnathostoma spinigerum]|uniref:Uncharacterized protein n=1 Tax=Gnathostoma spinigerum TaxID=75299 RepID=A0ABD6F281_9BILA